MQKIRPRSREREPKTLPEVQPGNPVRAPTNPVSTPIKPVSLPTKPVSAPTKPVSTPIKPVRASTKPVSTPTKPVRTPTKPVSTPTGKPAGRAFRQAHKTVRLSEVQSLQSGQGLDTEDKTLNGSTDRAVEWEYFTGVSIPDGHTCEIRVKAYDLAGNQTEMSQTLN